MKNSVSPAFSLLFKLLYVFWPAVIHFPRCKYFHPAVHASKLKIKCPSLRQYPSTYCWWHNDYFKSIARTNKNIIVINFNEPHRSVYANESVWTKHLQKKTFIFCQNALPSIVYYKYGISLIIVNQMVFYFYFCPQFKYSKTKISKKINKNKIHTVSDRRWLWPQKSGLIVTFSLIYIIINHLI